MCITDIVIVTTVSYIYACSKCSQLLYSVGVVTFATLREVTSETTSLVLYYQRSVLRESLDLLVLRLRRRGLTSNDRY